MKKQLFAAALLTGLFSCNTASIPETANPLVENLPPIETVPQQEELPSFDNYPFGCPALVRFAFADNWNIIDHSGSVNMGYSVYQKALLEINTCMQQINHTPPIEQPTIRKTEYIRYFKEDELTCNDAGSPDSILTPLPDMGKYKCYYAFGNIHNNQPEDALITPEDCIEYGNLVLIDPKTNDAKVLNLYMMKEVEGNIQLRLFYIDDQETIHIMEVVCGTKHCNILKRFTAKVNDRGDIEVEKE